MDNLFGISMNLIMYVLLGVLGLALSTVLYVVARNRVMFVIGVRNMPRRRSQTVLIIVGLMLSTLIISAAFTTGDTVNNSITSQAFSTLGEVDELVQVSTRGSDDESFDDHSFFDSSPLPPGPLDEQDAERLIAALAGNPDIDGIVPLSRQLAPVVNLSARQTEPAIVVAGVDPTRLAGFENDLQTVDGLPIELASLADDEIFVNESAAKTLAIEPGQMVQFFILGRPFDFKVVAVLKDRVLAGAGPPGFSEGALMPLERLQRLYNTEGEVDFLAISNRGGQRSGLGLTDDVVAAVEDSIAALGLEDTLEIQPTKQDQVELAELFGNVMTTFFVVLGLFSIASGMLLIFMIFVMLAAERKTEMGISRAIGMKRGHLVQAFLSEGMAYNILSAAVGAGLGVLVSLAVTRIMALIVGAFDLSISFHVTARSLIVSYSLGVVLTFLTVTFSAWRVSALNIVRAIRDIAEPKASRAGWRALLTGVAGLLLGLLILWAGLRADQGAAFGIGISLIAVGVTLVLRYFGAAERPLYTTIGLTILAVWALAAGGDLEPLPLVGNLDGGVEMFFLSGLIMIASATFVVVYNSDLLLWLLSKVGSVFTRILPAVKTAVAYPAENKFRSGMTLAMIGLVIFALTMMSTMNANFDRIFLSDDARGGWDVVAADSPSNPIEDLTIALNEPRVEAAGSDSEAASFDTSQIAATGRVGVANAARSGVQQLGEDGEPLDQSDPYQVIQAGPGWLAETAVPLQARAQGFGSDREVWDALRSDPGKAVIDAFALSGGGFDFDGGGFSLAEIDQGDTTFDSVTLRVQDRTSGRVQDVELIGIISTGASTTFSGLYVSQQTFLEVLGSPEFNLHFVRLQPGVDSGDAARAIEAALLERGVQADSIKERVEAEQRLSSAFFFLIQGFMGIGLFVGIAAVGVIAFRTVVERRQQIGMLRAIGYTRGMVSLSFLLESAFVTSLGIVSGVGLALLLAFQLLGSSEFAATGITGFFIPWLQVLAIAAFAFIASLLMTFIPARQAASVPIAEALRYE